MVTSVYAAALRRLVFAAYPAALRACTLFLLLLSLAAVAQGQHRVQGTVIDKDTQEPLPFVSIGVPGTTLGTASNANGEFSLNLPSLPQSLVFSEIAHVRDTVRVTSVGEPLKVTLASASIALPEVKVGSYAFQLVDRAYQHMKRHHDKKYYGKAFYRQITRVGNEPTELQEVVWDVKTNNARIEGTAIAQGRYAAKQAIMGFNNFSLYTKSFGLYDPQADSTVSLALLSPNVVKNYYLELKGILGEGEGGIAEISFETRPEVKNYQASGTIWVDVDSYKVVRYKMTTPKFTASANNPTYTFKNPKLEIDMVFQPGSTAPVSPLDHMQINLTADIGRTGLPDVPITANSFTFFFDTRETPTAIKYARVSTRDKGDIEAIRSIKYDPVFWANNPVVQRTPVEDEVIQSFEKKGAFGTMVDKPKKTTRPPARRGW